MCIGALKHFIVQDSVEQLVDLQVVEVSPCGSYCRVQRDDRPNEWRHKDMILLPDESVVCDLMLKVGVVSTSKQPLPEVKRKRRGRKPGGKLINGKYTHSRG